MSPLWLALRQLTERWENSALSSDREFSRRLAMIMNILERDRNMTLNDIKGQMAATVDNIDDLREFDESSKDEWLRLAVEAQQQAIEWLEQAIGKNEG